MAILKYKNTFLLLPLIINYPQPVVGLYRRRERIGSVNFWQPTYTRKVLIPT
jgi:hypothetical protein